MEAVTLAHEVVRVLQDKVVQERPKWAFLVGHCRNYEAWWKAELALALEHWTWSFRGEKLGPELGFVTEAKPRDYGFGTSQAAVDLLVGPWSEDSEDVRRDGGPRVWIELKERGDWWVGNAAKAVGTANGGLAHDMQKWADINWTSDDVVLACHLLSYKAPYERPQLGEEWQSAMTEATGGRKPFVDPLIVGYPLDEESKCLWMRMDVFPIHVPEESR